MQKNVVYLLTKQKIYGSINSIIEYKKALKESALAEVFERIGGWCEP